MIKILTNLLICSILTVGSLVALYEIANSKNHQGGSFLRLFPPHPVEMMRIKDIKFNSYYLAGQSSVHIYLANRIAPLFILVLDTALQDTQHFYLDIGRYKGLPWKNIQISIDSPEYTITDGTIPIMLRGNIHGGPIRQWDCPKYFTLAARLTDSAYAFRIQDPIERRYVLSKSIWASQKIQTASGVLTRQIDGLFCEDGMLFLDADRKRLFYAYYYRNQFICMNSSMQIVYKGNTIDTNSIAKIQIGEIQSDHSSTFTKPPLLINTNAAASANMIFIQSGQMARNEDPSVFQKQSTIDVYQAKTGQYQFSFHLFSQHKPIREFNANPHQLIALFDHYIARYDLVPKYFP